MTGEIAQCRFLVFDLEMTGLSPENDSIIEIGSVPLTGLAVDGDYFFTAVQPYTDVHAESKRIHGLDGDQLWQAPPAEVALSQFFKLIQGRILIGQKPELDLAFLWMAAKIVGGNIPHDWAIDISRIFRNVYPDQNYFSLDAMARRVGLNKRDEVHNALEDAILTAKILGRIMPRLQKMGVFNTGELISIGRTRMKSFR